MEYFSKYMQKIIYILIILFLISIVSNSTNAATIHGNIYDLSLSIVSGARISINTTPEQFLISKSGKYSLEIPKGSYLIRSELSKNNIVSAYEERNINVIEDGNYVIDFILFPSFDEEDDISKDLELDIPYSENGNFNLFFITIFIIGIIIIYYFFKKKRKIKIKENESNENIAEDELNNVIEIIKQENGRTTQKEIRKKIPVSEAKISLMIAELEHNGKIKKIKKGRGNIIILNK